MKRIIFRPTRAFSLLLSAGLLMNAGCTKEKVEPDHCGNDSSASPGELRGSPVSFMTWTALGTQYTIWKNGLKVGKLMSGMNPFGIQVASDNTTSITVEGVTYQPCTTTPTAGTFTFQKGTTAGSWGPYYDITGAGLPRLRFRIKNGLTPIGSDADGYFNLNNATSTWTTHSTTGTYFQWATNVIFNNNCLPH